MMLVLETTGTDVMWTEPRDLESDRISFVINSGLPGEIGSRHVRGGAQLLMADGSVHHVSELTTPAELRAMATIAGEAVSPRGIAK